MTLPGIKGRLSQAHARDLAAAICGGYNSDPIFIDARLEILRLEADLWSALLEVLSLRQDRRDFFLMREARRQRAVEHLASREGTALDLAYLNFGGARSPLT